MSLLSRRVPVGSRLGLERVERLCCRLGDPQHEIPVVHIAGTNGKGSAAAFLSAVLQETGLQVGLYTSPHLVSIEERYQVNRAPIGAEELAHLEAELEPHVEALERDHPELGPVTHFEIATVIAFMYFRQRVDILLLEVGLGGRLDATNVVVPQISVIMPVGFDHMDYLGDTLEAIAAEKAGIIKPGVPVVMSRQSEQAACVVRQTAEERDAPLYSTADAGWSVLHWDALGGSLRFPAWGASPISIKLLGRHQLDNAAAALMVLDVLRRQGLSITEAAVRRGMEAARWPCRMELISQDPWWLLDGAHNEDGIAALAESLRVLLGGQTVAFVAALLESKPPQLLDPLLPLAKRMVFTKPQSSRIPPHEPAVLAEYAVSRGISAEGFLDLAGALAAVRDERRVCVCGSLYLLGELAALRKERDLLV